MARRLKDKKLAKELQIMLEATEKNIIKEFHSSKKYHQGCCQMFNHNADISRSMQDETPTARRRMSYAQAKRERRL